ncbi:trehalose-phosphatase [Alsobacter sp. R-9]
MTVPCRHALFLDFDGTLVDIAPRPDAVRVEPGLSDAMARVAERMGGALALVSGRPVQALDRFLSPHRFDAAGLHGAELRLAGETLSCAAVPEAFRAEVARLRDAAGALGFIAEDKGASVALHWRAVPDLRPHVENLAAQALARLGSGWRAQTGKSVIEILPAEAGKGRAIATLLDHEPYRGRIPVFVGDDDTDEHGFAEVLARGGLAVRIGEGKSLAPLRLAGPAVLRARLLAWAETGTCPFETSSTATD